MISKKNWLKGILSFAIIGLGGCATTVDIPTPQNLSKKDPLKVWEEVLAKNVDSEGRVDFKNLQKDPTDLEIFVEYIASNGPKSKPQLYSNADARMAYYLNSYNALAMYGILKKDIPESLTGLGKIKFFYFTKFSIDGEKMSLYAYEGDVIRALGEERVHFALNCMTSGCPRLPQKPFKGETLDKDLAFQAGKFFRESRNVRVDDEKKEVYFSEILKFYTDDFLAKSKSLPAYANKYLDKKIPEDYKVKFIDYDWTVWIQPGK